MNGKTIQRHLVNYCMKRGNVLAVQNIFYWKAHESDVLALTKSGYLNEYEAKSSRSDFLNDFNKTEKHNALAKCHRSGNLPHSNPNRFYYVCPEGLLTIDDIPDYAGLLWVEPRGFIDEIVKAPKLHSEKIEPDFWQKIAMKLFWKTI